MKDQSEMGALGEALVKLPSVSKVKYLGEIAPIDPALAWTLIESGKVNRFGGLIDTGGWELFNLVARWEAGTADTPIPAKLQGTIESDIWVRAVRYTVRRPEYQSGSPWKGVWDTFNALNPNIDFTLVVKSYCSYVISPDPTPLENIREVFECACPVGLVWRCNATFNSVFTNLRAFGADEVPVEAIVTMSGMRLPKDLYGGCLKNYAVIVKDLQQQGILSP